MHELSLITDLMRKIDVIAREQGARRVVGVKVRLGALSHISPAHFREHFEVAATGTIAEAARLDFEALDHRIENNPGREKALAAAEAVSGVAIFPNFSESPFLFAIDALRARITPPKR